MPRIEHLIDVTHPEDRTRWLTLDGYYNWQQPTPPGEEKYGMKRRDLWYMLNGYLVRKADGAKLFAWAKSQSWMGRWMPESHESYGICLGEFFWCPAFKERDPEYDGRQGWTRIPRRSGKEIPVDILVANDGYGWESGGSTAQLTRRCLSTCRADTW